MRVPPRIRTTLDRTCVVSSLTLIVLGVWWRLRTGGQFVEGCHEQAVHDVWNLIGAGLFYSSLATLVLSLAALSLGIKRSGSVGVISSIAVIASLTYFSGVAIC